MFILVGTGIAITASLVRGGRLRHLASARMELPTSIVILALLGLATARIGPGGPGAADHVQLLLIAEQTVVMTIVAANLVRPGLALIGLGAVCNGLAILANRGMPVLGSAIRQLGGDPSAQRFTGSHHLAGPDTTLPLLIDRFGVAWLDVVVSVGDILVVLGLVLLSDNLLRPRVPSSRPPHNSRVSRATRPRRSPG